jgi:predicted ATP-grasp superfamily ATP-dependent carboligase
VLSTVRSPHSFFPLLDRLGIRHPEVRYTAPSDLAGWLVKEPGGAGGTRVRPAGRGRVRSTTYFQRHMPGQVCSVLFLANGRQAFVVGFNQQWTSDSHPALPFLYGGAVGHASLPAGVERAIRDRVDALAAATGLVGLNGIDFLLDGESWSVLELNPRPTATMELYDPDYERGLLEWHLRACSGELPGSVPASRLSRASTIVHAARPWQVAAAFEFPGWCRDLPPPGTRFASGDPVCTVHAEADTPEAAVSLVRDRQRRTALAFSEAAATTGVP